MEAIHAQIIGGILGLIVGAALVPSWLRLLERLFGR
jgi:hypothetical protein